MKGLRKYLTPFAPDQSGAVSVLYALGGILIIIDAGGCVGNICGFDEPRWQDRASAIFSAGLRDMDAILGRDELLVKKLAMAAEEIDASFIALIGTPVTAVIGTDYHALTRMAERKIKLPVLAIDTNGMELYDRGASKAYEELVRTFVGQQEQGEDAQADARYEDQKETGAQSGILGLNPLDMSDTAAEEKIRAWYRERGYSCCRIYGGADTMSWIREGNVVEKNIVVSPSGLAAARLLERKFGIPYICENPLGTRFAGELDKALVHGKRVLVVDQQISAESIRTVLERDHGAAVTTAGWFLMDPALRREGDVRLSDEDDFTELAESGNFDVIIGDPVLQRMAKHFQGTWIEKRAFSLSGKMEQ